MGNWSSAKTKGLVTSPRAIAEPPKVINLMEALKRSLAQDAEPEPKEAARARRLSQTGVKERCCCPYPGGRGKTDAAGGFTALYLLARSPHSSNKRPRARQSIVNELISYDISECLRAFHEIGG